MRSTWEQSPPEYKNLPTDKRSRLILFSEFENYLSKNEKGNAGNPCSGFASQRQRTSSGPRSPLMYLLVFAILSLYYLSLTLVSDGWITGWKSSRSLLWRGKRVCIYQFTFVSLLFLRVLNLLIDGFHFCFYLLIFFFVCFCLEKNSEQVEKGKNGGWWAKPMWPFSRVFVIYGKKNYFALNH